MDIGCCGLPYSPSPFLAEMLPKGAIDGIITSKAYDLSSGNMPEQLTGRADTIRQATAG